MKESGKDLRNLLISAAVFLAVILLFVGSTGSLAGKASTRGTESLRDAIRRASVQCYAIEGRYPPNVSYLEENYGISIDRNLYNVFYEGFASNLMPEISVFLKEPVKESEGGRR